MPANDKKGAITRRIKWTFNILSSFPGLTGESRLKLGLSRKSKDKHRRGALSLANPLWRKGLGSHHCGL
jgi:hypothetical protein